MGDNTSFVIFLYMILGLSIITMCYCVCDAFFVRRINVTADTIKRTKEIVK